MNNNYDSDNLTQYSKCVSIAGVRYECVSDGTCVAPSMCALVSSCDDQGGASVRGGSGVLGPGVGEGSDSGGVCLTCQGHSGTWGYSANVAADVGLADGVWGKVVLVVNGTGVYL